MSDAHPERERRGREQTTAAILEAAPALVPYRRAKPAPLPVAAPLALPEPSPAIGAIRRLILAGDFTARGVAQLAETLGPWSGRLL